MYKDFTLRYHLYSLLKNFWYNSDLIPQEEQLYKCPLGLFW